MTTKNTPEKAEKIEEFVESLSTDDQVYLYNYAFYDVIGNMAHDFENQFARYPLRVFLTKYDLSDADMADHYFTIDGRKIITFNSFDDEKCPLSLAELEEDILSRGYDVSVEDLKHFLAQKDAPDPEEQTYNDLIAALAAEGNNAGEIDEDVLDATKKYPYWTENRVIAYGALIEYIQDDEDFEKTAQRIADRYKAEGPVFDDIHVLITYRFREGQIDRATYDMTEKVMKKVSCILEAHHKQK